MSFFNKLGEKSQEALGKAMELAEITKIKNQISGLESNKKKLYGEVGTRIFTQMPEVVEQYFQEEANQLSSMDQQIAELNRQIAELKGTKNCPGCGKEVDKTTQFCPHCGYKFQEQTEQEPTVEGEE